MNRHARRVQATASIGKPTLPAEITKALATINSLQEFAAVADRLKPFLANAERLSAQLDEARSALALAQAENVSLRTVIEHQRQVFLRMFAQGMGIPLTEVLSIEASIQGQLTDAHSPAESEPTAEAQDPSA
jgi:hypothetical protein